MVDVKVMIAVPTAEMARQAVFYDYFYLLDKPAGTILIFSHGQSPARNRNLMIEQALNLNCTHILFIDDDVAFPRDGLDKLLAHDLDIVTGLYLMRAFPHQPIIFDYSDENGACRHHYLDDNESGLIEIVNCGLGFCLIKTEVFKQLNKPWITLGELEKDHWCDDISFFNRARRRGFKIYCDLSVQVGHFVNAAVFPKYADGKWTTEYDTNGSTRISFPAIRPLLNEAAYNTSQIEGASSGCKTSP